MQLKPLHDRLVVRAQAAETKSAGGIVIPDNAQEKPTTGEVLAVGPGRVTQEGQTVAMTVKVGDRVMFGKFSGTNIKVDGEEITVLREEDIFAIVE